MVFSQGKHYGRGLPRKHARAHPAVTSNTSEGETFQLMEEAELRPADPESVLCFWKSIFDVLSISNSYN